MATERFHNQPESGALSHIEHETIEAGRLALSSLHKTFDLWIAVARAIKTLRDKADRMGGRNAFQHLMAQNGFRMDGTPHEKIIDKGIVSKLLSILDRLPEVTAWYEKLTPKQKREWAAPSTVYKHCPLFKKPVDPNVEKPLSPMAKLQMANVELQEENHRLKKREDGDTFKESDKAEDIATALVGQFVFNRKKLEKVAKLILEKLKDKPKEKKTPTSAKKKDKADDDPLVRRIFGLP
jgi:hypothetical protein